MYGTVLSAIPDSGSNIYCNPIGEENERNRYMGCYHMGYVLGNGWIQYLLALGGVGILIFGRKKGIALRLFLYDSSAGIVFLPCIRTRDYALYRKVYTGEFSGFYLQYP